MSQRRPQPRCRSDQVTDCYLEEPVRNSAARAARACRQKTTTQAISAERATAGTEGSPTDGARAAVATSRNPSTSAQANAWVGSVLPSSRSATLRRPATAVTGTASSSASKARVWAPKWSASAAARTSAIGDSLPTMLADSADGTCLLRYAREVNEEEANAGRFRYLARPRGLSNRQSKRQAGLRGSVARQPEVSRERAEAGAGRHRRRHPWPLRPRRSPRR